MGKKLLLFELLKTFVSFEWKNNVIAETLPACVIQFNFLHMSVFSAQWSMQLSLPNEIQIRANSKLGGNDKIGKSYDAFYLLMLSKDKCVIQLLLPFFCNSFIFLQMHYSRKNSFFIGTFEFILILLNFWIILLSFGLFIK